jgi:hypothetical protein
MQSDFFNIVEGLSSFAGAANCNEVTAVETQPTGTYSRE